MVKILDGQSTLPNKQKQKKKELDIISFILFSEKRKNLLLFLRNGSKTLDEIKESLNVTSSGIIPQLRKMEERGLIYRKNKNYSLTDIGLVIAKSFDRFNRIVETFEKNRKFWEDHEISGIPEEFLLRIYELGDYEIIEGDEANIFKPHEEYIKNLSKARWVRGVFPVLHPDYPKIIIMLARNGADISIIMPENVLKRIRENYLLELEKGLSYENVRFFVCNKKVEVAFTVTDFFLTLRLFMKDKTYDFYRNIMSYDKSALAWGYDLYRYFEKQSKLVTSVKFL